MNASVQQLVETGSALRDALQREDWSAIGELDLRCRQVVEQALHEAERDESQIRARLEDLLDLYGELVAHCQAAQKRLANELIQLNQSRQGAQVYRLFG